MRVIHTTSCLSDRGGGIPPVIWALSREMSLTGVDCVVAGSSDDPAAVEKRNGCTTMLTGKNRGAFGFSRGVYRNIATSIVKDSVVHSHGLWTYPGIAARKAASRTGAPLVISTHGMLDAWALRHSALKKHVAARLFENKNLRHAACLHALSEAEAGSYRNYGLRNPICVIPNGVDVPKMQDADQKNRNSPWKGRLPGGQKVLLYLGRIHPKKGLVNLIRAWAAVSVPEWGLAIAGWDQEGHEAELKGLCTEMGVPFFDLRSPISDRQSPNSICFLGPQFGGSKSACYANCDAFILPSFSEGLPMVILEAWAYGKPVLMTPECNLPEGFATNAAIRIESDIRGITAGLDCLFHASGGQVKALGANGRSLVSARFNWPSCAQEMLRVYQWLLGNGAKPNIVV